jgi:hypothetical protein
MNKIIYTDKEQQNFINRCDPDLLIEVHENNMLGEDITFSEFLDSYNRLHLAKYGNTLSVTME